MATFISQNILSEGGITGTTINATTYYGDGSNLTGISSSFTTGSTASVQARRSTIYTLTNTYTNITFDITDIENSPSIISHDTINTDRIYIYESGLYELHYHCDLGENINSPNDYDLRLLKNNLSVINGSVLSGKSSSTDRIIASLNTIFSATSGDFITLQARYPVDIGAFTNNTVLSVKQLKGLRGDTGPQGPTGPQGTGLFTGGTITAPTNFTGGLTTNSIYAPIISGGTLYGDGSNLTGIIGGGGSGLATGNTVSVQARRTTSYTLTATFANITLDVTDIENDPTVISHDNTNTDRIYIYNSGLYEIHYHCDVAQGTTTNDFELRLFLNNLSEINGSLIAGKNSSTDKVTASVNTIFSATSGNFITLQARYPASSGGLVNNTVLSVKQLKGSKGDPGDQGPTGPQGTGLFTGGTISNPTRFTGGLSANTFTITTIPTNNNLNTQILTRNSSNGSVEYLDSSVIIALATPKGNTNEVQYNGGGVFSGASNVEINSGNLQLVSTTDPTAPTAGNIILYSKDIGGRQMPKWIGPSGVDTPIQANIMFNNVSVIGPGGGTTVGVLGCTVTSVGTVSNPSITTTNLKTQTRRITNTSAAGAGSLSSTYVSSLECWRGNVAGQGGFFIVARFGLTTLQAGMRAFVGLTDTATVTPTNINPTTSTTPGKIGMAIAANTGNWNLVHNITGTAPTIIALGASFPVNNTDLLELVLFAKPNDTVVTYRITNLSTNAQTTGTLSSNLPATTTPLGRTIWATNNATAAAVAWDLSRFSLETDY